MMSSGTDITGGVVSIGEAVASTVFKNELVFKEDFVVDVVAITVST
jgi:hypothetical protein